LTLIYAADLLIHRHKITNFVIEYAGDGPDLMLFKDVVKTKSLERHFIFLGVLDSTRDVVCKADIVVVPSSWGDACPSSVSEALAAGKPLITTTAGGIPEMVGGESNAILVPPSDEKSLAGELAGLITNERKRKRLGVSARARAENALDEKVYYRTVITQLMAELF
jgi:glycosyltransferase involved in cell wall biosynthesis